MTNSKTIFKQKSKLLLTLLCLLGLAFSYSCTCRSPQGEGGGGFKVEASVASDTIRVDKNNAVYGNSEIVINVSEKNGKTIDVTVSSIVDTATEDALNLASEDYDYTQSTGKFKLLSGGLKKVGALNTDNGPNDRTLKLTFKAEASDNTANITKEIHLIKVKDIDNNYILTTLKNDTEDRKAFSEGETDDSQLLNYNMKDVKDGGNALEFKADVDTLTTDFSKSKLKRKVIAEIDKVLKTAGIDKTEASDENIGLSGNDITFKIKFTFNENYDGSQMTNPMEVILKKSGTMTWVE